MNLVTSPQSQNFINGAEKDAVRVMLLQETRELLKRKGKDSAFNKVASLPPSFQLTYIHYQKSGPTYRGYASRSFDSARRIFIRHIANNHADALVRMNVGLPQIELMRIHGKPPTDKDGHPYACNVDHNISRALGGTNEISNLSLVPKDINALKSLLETLQLTNNTFSGRIITITAHKHGDSYDPVPYVPGGFRTNGLHFL